MNRKKNILFTIFFTMMISSVWSQIDTVSLRSFGLKGKVASITDYSYLLREDEKAKDFSIGDKSYMLMPLDEDWELSEEKMNQETNVTFDFDKQGRNTKITYYFTPGKPNDMIVFKYDKKGKIEASENFLFYSDGNYAIESIYTYDKQGKLVKSEKKEGKRLIEEAVYKYNPDGHLIEKVVTSDGTISEKDIRDYEKSNLIFENIIIPNKERKSTYKYDKEDRVVYLKILYPEHGVFHQTVYEYEDGLLRKASHLNDLKQETICEYEYAGGKLFKEKCYDATGKSDFMIEKENQYKNSSKSIITRYKDVLLEEKEYNKKGYIDNYLKEETVYSYKYQYDNKGNWIQILQYENGEPIKLRTREIKYY